MNTEPNQLLTITQKNDQMWVDARSLHQALGVGKMFAHWVSKRLEDTDAVEGEDFLPILAESTGGRPAREYLLSLNLAKEVAMLEKNELHKAIRRYYINAEEESPMNEMNFVHPDLLVDSRIIAQALENQHASSMLLIQNNLTHFEGFGRVRFEIGTVTNSVRAVNQTKYALLNEDQCYFLLSLSRNSAHVVALKAKLVTAFRQAREASRPALPTNMVEALRLAADALEAKELAVAENQQLTQALEVAAPKAASFDRYLSTDAPDDAVPVAKSRGRDRMFEELRRQKILKSSKGKENQPYAKYIKAGYFNVKVWMIRSESECASNAGSLSTTVYLTPKGVAFLHRRLRQGSRRQVVQYQNWVTQWCQQPLELITTPWYAANSQKK